MYNEIILSYLSNPYHNREMPDADSCAQEGMPGYGPYMAIYLRVKKATNKSVIVEENVDMGTGSDVHDIVREDSPHNDQCVIEEATFQTYHCPAAVACGSWLTKWLEGKTLEQAATLEWEDMNRVLGGLPLGKEHAAQNAVKALQGALRKLRKQDHNSSGIDTEETLLDAQA